MSIVFYSKKYPFIHHLILNVNFDSTLCFSCKVPAQKKFTSFTHRDTFHELEHIGCGQTKRVLAIASRSELAVS